MVLNLIELKTQSGQISMELKLATLITVLCKTATLKETENWFSRPIIA